MHNRLTLDTFALAGNDPEGCQYRILASLKSYYEEFSHNRVYPSLSDLLNLVTELDKITRDLRSLEEKFPHGLTGIDLQTMKLITEPECSKSPELAHFTEVVGWAMPRLRKAVDEGAQIFDFVEENMSLNEVGVLPIRQGEGYVITPDNEHFTLHVMYYELSLYEDGEDKFRAIRTKVLKSIPQSTVHSEPRSIKLDIIREHPELPNPATFELQTDLDFPFHETILPVAKRKLMARLAA